MCVIPLQEAGSFPGRRRVAVSSGTSQASSSRQREANDQTAAGTPTRLQTSTRSTSPSNACRMRSPSVMEPERSTSSSTAGSRRTGRTGRLQSERYRLRSASNATACRRSSRAPDGDLTGRCPKARPFDRSMRTVERPRWDGHPVSLRNSRVSSAATRAMPSRRSSATSRSQTGTIRVRTMSHIDRWAARTPGRSSLVGGERPKIVGIDRDHPCGPVE